MLTYILILIGVWLVLAIVCGLVFGAFVEGGRGGEE